MPFKCGEIAITPSLSSVKQAWAQILLSRKSACLMLKKRLAHQASNSSHGRPPGKIALAAEVSTPRTSKTRGPRASRPVAKAFTRPYYLGVRYREAESRLRHRAKLRLIASQQPSHAGARSIIAKVSATHQIIALFGGCGVVSMRKI